MRWACRDREIILLQILPNALPPVIVVSSLMVATAILTESGLSFLGLGDPNVVSWGYMIGVARTVAAHRLVDGGDPRAGDPDHGAVRSTSSAKGLNDALNPRLQQPMSALLESARADASISARRSGELARGRRPVVHDRAGRDGRDRRRVRLAARAPRRSRSSRLIPDRRAASAPAEILFDGRDLLPLPDARAARACAGGASA